MNQSDKAASERDALACLQGGGAMGALMRSLDWSKTPLGPVARWSPTLQTTVRTLLVNRFPLLLWWGPQYIQLYNDAYRPIPGAKHPKSLGQPASECWPEIWHIIGPLIDTPFRGGQATWMEDIFLEVNRHGFVEETHFTIAYSPVPDDTAAGGIGGVLGTVHEITEKVVGERRMAALRDLGTRPAEAKTAEEACAVAAETLKAHSKDVPFALLYLADTSGKHARLAGAAGVPTDEAISPEVVDLDPGNDSTWPLGEVRRTEEVKILADLGSHFSTVPPGPWSDPPHIAVVLPIRSSKAHELTGFFIAGISARLRLDDSYRVFLELATAQIATAIANARAYEEEKRRAEALAEIDRAKTVFFTNVSHELRTPLTLMLGPVEELLVKGRPDLSPAARDQLEVVNRNGMRLLRLVNTLLDFSRIEAGRVRAVYQPTDLAAYTADLASVFRAACARAGLRLVVDCPPLAEPVYVDRGMWEKIVLNLLSNAFKFTFEGEIAVSLRQGEPGTLAPGVSPVELRVRDTGTGIPAEEMPRLFDRFYRIENARGRTHEGSGIGLALVQELVKLHGGSIAAQSQIGTGTTLTVTVPLGSAHLPPEQIGADHTAPGARPAPYVEEVLQWLPSEEKDDGGRMKDEIREDVFGISVHPSSFILHPSQDDRPCVLVADDNADMRQYVVRLLAEHYRIEAVPDGEAALAAARRQPPDLILTDVMMPRLDGFGLLRELRADSRTRGVPIIMLSARAGEESRVEGMEAGADDYLVKPFGARELLARVSAHLKMARMRREADQKKDEFLATLAHELRNPLAPLRSGLQLMKLANNNGKAVEQARTMMERQLGHLVHLVDDLLDVSRISQGKIELRKERITLSAVVSSAVETCDPIIKQSGHELTLTIPDEPIYVDADKTRLAQALCNLVSNAAKYTEKGGHIWLTVRRHGGEAAISVKDTGVGIPAHMLPKIFDLFTQVDRSLERSQGGLGIGLTLVKRLVEMHGGSIQAKSEGHGMGSEFIMHLPIILSRDAERKYDAPGGESAGAVARRRILIVDDNRDAALSLAMMLQLMGNETQTAHDGLEAVEAAAAFKPDVALLDIGMPKLNGYDACRRIRQQPWGKNMVLVACTGWGQEEDKQRSQEAGFNFHLVKPVDPAALEKMLGGLKAATG